MQSNKTRLEKFNNLIPIFCEKTGIEFVEEEWQAGMNDMRRVSNILTKPKIRQGDAIDVFINSMGFPMIPAGVGIPPLPKNIEMSSESLKKSIRFLDALKKTSDEPGNFKAKAASERIGERFYDKISETLFKEFDPSDIVKMRKEGLL